MIAEPAGGMVQTDRPDAAAQISSVIFAVMLLDADSTIVEANQATENLLSRGASRMIGQNAWDIVSLVDGQVSERLNDAEGALVARNVGIRINGQEKRVNLTVSPMAAYPGWRVMTISDAGRDEEGREEKLDATALGTPSILAHEIKNPLAAIRGAGQLIARKLKPEDMRLARMITDEVDRIARLIDRMQQLGSSASEPVGPVNLHEAIRSAIATVRAASSSEVEIDEEFDPSLPPVLANQDALEQVLINLISNARDAASENGGGQVNVRTRFVSGLAFSAIRFGKKVKLPIEITVTDNGGGIPARIRDHVFEPFISSKKSGQGLGLALVRKLVRDMNGRINHDRDDAHGLTHFRIHLPRAVEGAM